MEDTNKPKLALIVDQKGWVLDHFAKKMRRELSDYDIDIIDGWKFTKKVEGMALKSNQKHDYIIDYMAKYDILHFISWPFMVMWRSKHPKIVASIHSYRSLEQYDQFYMRDYAAVITAVNPELAKRFDGVFIPNAVDDEFYVTGHKLRVGFAARKDDYKGFEIIQRACELGSYEFKPVEDLPHDKMPEYYREIDVYVSASINEGFGMGMAEAAAMGVPVVSTDCWLARWLGATIVDRTPEAIKDGIRKHDRFKLARAVRTMFSWKRVLKEYDSIYKSLI